jgi:maltose-binding protein MalE
MRRTIATTIAAAILLAGAVACGGKDSSESPGTKSSAEVTAVDKYCELVKDALAATKSGDPEKVKVVVPELQKAYPAALAATKKDPTLAKRFADCAKGEK